MKPHIIIILNPQIEQFELPHWESLIYDKSKSSNQFLPEVKELFKKEKFDVVYSTEYKKQLSEWTKDEKEAHLNNVYRIIILDDDPPIDTLVQKLKNIPKVEKAYSGSIVTSRIPEVSMSQSFSRQHPGDLIGLSDAHAYSKGDPQVKIAVLDTGVDVQHDEIKSAMLPGKDFVNIINGAKQFIGDFLDMDDDPFDEVGHGTHVSGIICSKGNKMPIGVVPNCKIIPVRVLGALQSGDKVVGAGLVDNINNGIKWAVDNGADIINMSLGIKHMSGGLPHQSVIKYAQSKGVSIVAASGNDGLEDKYYPGALPGVTAVGASQDDRKVAAFSTFGRHISFIAPGTNIFSSVPGNSYSIASGTSQASPFVAGTFALLRSYAKKNGHRLTDKQTKYILAHSSDRFSQTWKDLKSGLGMINLIDAIKLLQYKLNKNHQL